MNEVWRCVYKNADQLYFAKVINDEVIISDHTLMDALIMEIYYGSVQKEVIVYLV